MNLFCSAQVGRLIHIIFHAISNFVRRIFTIVLRPQLAGCVGASCGNSPGQEVAMHRVLAPDERYRNLIDSTRCSTFPLFLSFKARVCKHEAGAVRICTKEAPRPNSCAQRMPQERCCCCTSCGYHHTRCIRRPALHLRGRRQYEHLCGSPLLSELDRSSTSRFLYDVVTPGLLGVRPQHMQVFACIREPMLLGPSSIWPAGQATARVLESARFSPERISNLLRH